MSAHVGDDQDRHQEGRHRTQAAQGLLDLGRSEDAGGEHGSGGGGAGRELDAAGRMGVRRREQGQECPRGDDVDERHPARLEQASDCEDGAVSETTPTGRPGRYPRTTGGLIGAIIVLVLLVIAIVFVRGAFRETPTYEPEHIDYLALVTSVQQAGLTPAYPAELPEGWYVKDAAFTPGDRPVLDLAMTTDDERFAGVHQEDRSAGELVDTYLGGDATEGDPVRITGSVAPEWRTFSDSGGDHAFAAELGEEVVVVYGSASEDDLRALVESLTTAPLTP